MSPYPSQLSLILLRYVIIPVVVFEGLPDEFVPSLRVSELQTADGGTARGCSHHKQKLFRVRPRWREAVEEVNLVQVLESLHPQEGTQQRGPPKVNVLVKLEAEDLELASRASELLEDLDPEATASVEISCGGELFMYLQSDISKVDLIPLADPSEPRMRVGRALEPRVSCPHYPQGVLYIWRIVHAIRGPQ